MTWVQRLTAKHNQAIARWNEVQLTRKGLAPLETRIVDLAHTVTVSARALH